MDNWETGSWLDGSWLAGSWGDISIAPSLFVGGSPQTIPIPIRRDTLIRREEGLFSIRHKREEEEIVIL